MEYLTESHSSLAESQLGLIRSRFSQLNETARAQVKSPAVSGGKKTYLHGKVYDDNYCG